MKIVHFTAPNGRVASVIADQVQAIRDAAPGEYAPGAQTVLVLANGVQAVRESRAEVEQRLQSS